MTIRRTLDLGIDVGTQGTKGLLVDVDLGRIVARAGVSYGLLEGLAPGAAEQDPETWVAAVATVARELAAAAAREDAGLGAVAISGQQHGAVVLDAEERVVRPAKLWCDTETAPEAAELSKRLGRHVPTGFTASKLLWIRKHEPLAWARVRSVLLPHDYLNFRLSGTRAMEAGDASGTGFFDPRRREFDPVAMAEVAPDLASMLPAIAAPGSIIGRVSAAAAARFGLPEGLPIATGGGDNMMSAIGSGATREGVLVLSLGTSGTVFARSDTPVLDPAGLIAPFCDSAGGWLPLLCVMNATGVLEEVCRAFCADGSTGHETLTEAAEKVPPLCAGVRFLPYLVGERVPDLPQATGAILGLRPGLLRPGLLYRAALEGIALNVASGVARLFALGLSADTVRLVGGGAKNALWRRILADALGLPLVVPEETESAALGAAIQASWARRRAAGEAIGLDELARKSVRIAHPPVVPDPAAVTAYGAARAEFEAHTGRLFG